MNHGRHDALIKEWSENGNPKVQGLIDGEWLDEANPIWSEDTAYRLVYPPTQTLDQMIARLQQLREMIGSDCQVFVDGWNDTGIVKPYGPTIINVVKTQFPDDGEIMRAWEESESGDKAVLIS